MKRMFFFLVASLGAALAGPPFVVAPSAPQVSVATSAPSATANSAVSQIIAQQNRQQAQLSAAAAQTARPIYVPQRVTIKTGK